MDDQIRNRFKRYEGGGAPLRPRPNAPQTPMRPQTAPPLPPKTQIPHPTPQAPRPMPAAAPQIQPMAGPGMAPRREPVPDRQSIARPATRAQEPPVATKSTRTKKAKKRGRKKGRKFLTALLILMLLGGSGASGYWFVVKPRLQRANTADQTAQTDQAAKPAPGKKIRLVAIGDSMNYSSINIAAQSGGTYDYLSLMADMKPVFEKAAIRICSQTVPSTTAQPVSGPPTFNAPAQFVKGFEDLGCNVMDLASPNANDKGQAGVDGSVGNFEGKTSILAFAGVNRSAEEQGKIRYFTVEGLKFAYLSYTTATNVATTTPFSVNIYSDELADKQLKEAREQANIVIVSMHWGADQSAEPNADQERIAQHLATANVDIVIGNGPHVIQPVKVLNGTEGHQTLVWFSLGNFLNSQVPLETLVGGMAVMEIDSSTQQLHDPRILPLYMHYEWTPEQKQRHNDTDLLARKNFKLLPLDKAAELLAKSQNNTTVEAQKERVKGIVSKYFTIPVITSDEL